MGCFGLAYDVQENKKEIVFTMGVPGMKKEDIEIKIRDSRRLVLRSLKSTKYTPDFHYAFVLPCEISKRGAIASMEDGVLTVKLERKEVDEFRIKLA
jgi:HSP20 family molecular chaperone IbpA